MPEAPPAEPPPLSAATTMRDLLAAYPGAQRALFARYHIGGCSSCAFRPDETLAELCARNENIPVEEMIAHLQDSHEGDAQILVEPAEFEALRQGGAPVLDIRTREEFDAVQIPGAQLFSNDLIQAIFATWDKAAPVLIYDHSGTRCLDAAAYLIGHGFAQTKALRGGIDAYAQQVDPSLPRYRIEFDD